MRISDWSSDVCSSDLTFGHALEAETGYGDELLHGEAVAVGMTMAFDLSVQRGHCAAEAADRVRRHLAAVGLPTGRSEERRVGTECGSTCRSRWSPSH